MNKKSLVLLLFLLLLTSCITTSAILRNKTIIKPPLIAMPQSGIALGYPHKSHVFYDIYEELGLKWLRIDLSWDKLEPQKGQWNFTEMDLFVNEAVNRGYKILAILSYDNTWIHEDGEIHNTIEEDQIDDFLNYVNVVIGRYENQIDEWEIWNEPNLPFNTFWKGSNKEFFALSTAVAAEIRNNFPNEKIMAGAHWRFDKSYIRKMFNDGVLDNVDIFSYHPYYRKPEKIYDKSRELQDYLKYLGFRGEFRVTEAGFSTYGNVPTSCEPEEQGRLVLESLILLGSLKHPYIIWYSLYNAKTDENSGLWSDQYGVLLKEGDQFEYKTGAWALRRYSELIAGTYPSKDRITYEEGIEKKLAATLYWDGTNNHSRTLVLFGEKKEIPLNITGFEKGTIYNCSNGEIFTVENEINGTLLYNEPYIMVLDNVTNLSIQENED